MSRSINRRAASRTEPPEEIARADQIADGAAPQPVVRAAPRKQRLTTIPSFPADNDAVPDFAAELEAALMNDLQTVSSFWSEQDEWEEEAVLPEPVLPEPVARQRNKPAPEPVFDDVEASYRGDRLAFETLIKRGPERSRPIQPRPPVERRLPAPTDSEMPGSDDESASRWVEPAAADEGEDQAPAAERLGMPRLNRGLIAIAAVALLVGTGAFVTLQSVKARTEQPADPASDQAALAAPAVAAPAPASQKTSYERAPADESLTEAPQLRGTDIATVSSVSKTPSATPPAAAVPPAADPVVTAAADPAPVETPAPAPVIVDDTATSDANPDVAAPAAPRVAALTPSTVKKPLGPPAVASGSATILSGVRLRLGPDNNAATVTLLKAGMTVQVLRCKGWCEIVANGQRGYVFQRFLGPVKAASPAKGAASTALF